MKWCTIDKDYIDFLKKTDKRIPNIEYGKNAFKPFFSPLFERNGLVYVSQVTSPKPRHYKLKESQDFLKLYDNNRLIGAVNLNYMFPVPKALIINVEYNNIQKFRMFNNNEDKSKYINLLKAEMKEIKTKDIQTKAKNLYKLFEKSPEHNVVKRCLNFKLLERKSIQYCKDHNIKLTLSPAPQKNKNPIQQFCQSFADNNNFSKEQNFDLSK